MKIHFALTALAAASLCLASCGQAPVSNWAPAGDHIRTRWAADVDPSDVHPEYPRPQMVRTAWQSLNGLWDYAITPSSATEMPAEPDGQILVPFAAESSLSGVARRVTQDDVLWYETRFKVPRSWKSGRVLLHFDGVDWKTEATINGQPLPVHTGAYTAFEYDITPYLAKGEQVLRVKVSDATDHGDLQPRGKQVSRPGGIWYTAVTGIWKSVWIEPVPESHIVDYDIVSDIDAASLRVSVKSADLKPGDVVRVELLEGAVGYATDKPAKRVLAQAEAAGAQAEAVLQVPDMHLWSPDDPYLYGLAIRIMRGGKSVDEVQAYTAMRKISKVRDAQGHLRMALNNKPLFQYGPLDQGWWPDGLYTAPTDEAMRYDIEQTKAHGFNMIRKHIKVEPFTWFYACDQLGVLVWQDMPSFADNSKNHWRTRAYATPEDDFPASPEARQNYYKEWGEIIAQVRKFQSVVVWVPFNEAWSQFETEKGVAFTYAQDDTRLVNMASGGNWVKGVGDILDSHNYPHPAFRIQDPDMVNVVGEYGGIGLPVEGHLWRADRNWGYVQYKNGDEVTATYEEYAAMMEELARQGCAAAVYTQTTDVEVEVNGLMTYDREVIKMDVARVREANRKVIDIVR